jgi:mannitol-1-phosphate 5-dehydrogenase
MPVIAIFGAGNIGRGFIAPLACASGWRAVFVDVSEALLRPLRERRCYRVLEVTNDGERPVTVAPVDAIDGRDGAAVAALLADCELAATAVGLNALRFLGPNLAKGLAARGGRPLDILVCENGVQATEMLRAAIAEHLDPVLRPRLDHLAGLIRTSIGRMIPPPAPGADVLDIQVEPYAKLPVEARAFRNAIPAIKGLKPADDFDLVLRQKLYLHNMTHAVLAYGGIARGYETIPDCVADAGLLARAQACGAEAAAALASAHGGGDATRQQAVRAACDELLEDLWQRYTNRPLGDPVRRVGRDPWRKLAGDDRLLGPARLAAAHGIAPRALAHAILDACAWPVADDEPRAAEFRTAAASGWRNLLHESAALDAGEPLMSALVVAERQRQAADLIRQSGIYLHDHEVAEIEIADFGLGRYEQVGLAIHVYVNTARCCAKELAMLPGMMCPEHRHPSVDGRPGKEETFRVRSGEVFMVLPGKGDAARAAQINPGGPGTATTVNQIYHLRQGDQITLPPDTKHWFVAGAKGAVVSEFSTRSRDDADIFTDPAIVRVPVDGPHKG